MKVEPNTDDIFENNDVGTENHCTTSSFAAMYSSIEPTKQTCNIKGHVNVMSGNVTENQENSTSDNFRFVNVTSDERGVSTANENIGLGQNTVENDSISSQFNQDSSSHVANKSNHGLSLPSHEIVVNVNSLKRKWHCTCPRTVQYSIPKYVQPSIYKTGGYLSNVLVNEDDPSLPCLYASHVLRSSDKILCHIEKNICNSKQENFNTHGNKSQLIFPKNEWCTTAVSSCNPLKKSLIEYPENSCATFLPNTKEKSVSGINDSEIVQISSNKMLDVPLICNDVLNQQFDTASDTFCNHQSCDQQNSNACSFPLRIKEMNSFLGNGQTFSAASALLSLCQQISGNASGFSSRDISAEKVMDCAVISKEIGKRSNTIPDSHKYGPQGISLHNIPLSNHSIDKTENTVLISQQSSIPNHSSYKSYFYEQPSTSSSGFPLQKIDSVVINHETTSGENSPSNPCCCEPEDTKAAGSPSTNISVKEDKDSVLVNIQIDKESYTSQEHSQQQLKTYTRGGISLKHCVEGQTEFQFNYQQTSSEPSIVSSFESNNAHAARNIVHNDHCYEKPDTGLLSVPLCNHPVKMVVGAVVKQKTINEQQDPHDSVIPLKNDCINKHIADFMVINQQVNPVFTTESTSMREKPVAADPDILFNKKPVAAKIVDSVTKQYGNIAVSISSSFQSNEELVVDDYGFPPRQFPVKKVGHFEIDQGNEESHALSNLCFYQQSTDASFGNYSMNEGKRDPVTMGLQVSTGINEVSSSKSYQQPDADTSSIPFSNQPIGSTASSVIINQNKATVINNSSSSHSYGQLNVNNQSYGQLNVDTRSYGQLNGNPSMHFSVKKERESPEIHQNNGGKSSALPNSHNSQKQESNVSINILENCSFHKNTEESLAISKQKDIGYSLLSNSQSCKQPIINTNEVQSVETGIDNFVTNQQNDIILMSPYGSQPYEDPSVNFDFHSRHVFVKREEDPFVIKNCQATNPLSNSHYQQQCTHDSSVPLKIPSAKQTDSEFHIVSSSQSHDQSGVKITSIPSNNETISWPVASICHNLQSYEKSSVTNHGCLQKGSALREDIIPFVSCQVNVTSNTISTPDTYGQPRNCSIKVEAESILGEQQIEMESDDLPNLHCHEQPSIHASSILSMTNVKKEIGCANLNQEVGAELSAFTLSALDGNRNADSVGSCPKLYDVAFNALCSENNEFKQCKICGFTTTQSNHRKALQNHMLVHSDRKPYKCDICKKSFKTNSMCRMHLRVHSEDNFYFCNICNEGFNASYKLSTHKAKHKERQEHKCPFCEKTFLAKYKLKAHFTVHTGERPFSCHICQKTFSNPRSCRKHVLIHDTSKTYVCSVCGKQFYNKKYLEKVHMRMHDENRSFECDICGKKFNFPTNLIQHKLVHSDKRLHECQRCGKSFKLPHHLRQHESSLSCSR